MDKEEYKKIVKEQFDNKYKNKDDESSKENSTIVAGIIGTVIIGVLFLILSFAIPMSTLIDIILELDGIAFGLLLIMYFYKSFTKTEYPKKILSYLVEESTFPFKPSIASQEIFMRNLTNYGFTALFVRINDKVFCFEAKVKEVDKQGIDNIESCVINFSKPMSVDDFLNRLIDGVKIGEMKEFEVLSINFGEPINFLIK